MTNSINVTIQSGRPSARITLSDEAQQDVEQAYLVAQRQRFKLEVNRLTGGEMLRLLQKQPDDRIVNRAGAENLAFLMSYVYAWHWLQHNVHTDFQQPVLAIFSKGKQAFLMDMLLQSDSSTDFVRRYIDYWQNYRAQPQRQQQQLLQLLEQHGSSQDDSQGNSQDNSNRLVDYIESIWSSMNLFGQTYKAAYKDLAKQEKNRYASMLADEDRQRLALVDQLPDTQLPGQFDKLGIIPAMGCPQTCRHCMFIFRPLMKNTDDPAALYQMVNSLTRSILFTGGDLSLHLHHFYDAIDSMQNITTFAILLNGDFADSRNVARQVLGKMAAAVRRRPSIWPKAKVMLQISFDEFHQEVVVDRHGQLSERIPVTKIANIIEAAPAFAEDIQLCLLHKQGHLNFSMALFEKGVFARLARELGRRGHQVQVTSTAPSSRLKRNPLAPAEPAALIKDATFILTKYPDVPVMFTSSTIDAYGRANMMGLHEAVNERDLLQQVLSGQGSGGETFDKDLMFWFNGWATLFSAVHVCLGNVFDDGMETIRRRQLKDPLSNALNRFDLRLLDFYREKSDDLDAIIETSTSPHHLFHTITEDSHMRLHMTRRLIDQSCS